MADSAAPIPAVRAVSFRAARGLRHPQMQAILATKRPAKRIWQRRGLDLDARSTVHVLDVRDEAGKPVRLTGAYTPHAEARGLVVLIHGWEGSHHSKYLYSMGCSLHRAGYAVFRLNLRDHNDTHALNEDIFHSARIAEVVGAIQATQRLDGRLASLPLSVVGFSLGGNFALRVGLRGPGYGLQPRLCIGISPAIHPRHTLEAIDAGPRLFHRYFLHKWRQDMDDKAAAWPDRYDFRPYRRIANFVEITRVFAGQFTGYAGLDDYLEAYTVRPARMMDSPTPLAVLTARDDSIIPYADFNGLATRGSMVDFEVTDSGGHCGFIENWRMECWAETRVLELLARM